MMKTSLLALGMVGLGLMESASAQDLIGTPVVGPVESASFQTTVQGAPVGQGVIVGSPVPAPVGGHVVGSPAPCACGGSAHGASAPAGIVGGPIGGSAATGFPGGTAGASGPVHAYSYYVEFPNPARTYVPYGPTDTFPFRGQAYGHAYDRWTWSAMSTGSSGFGRYYQLLH